METYPQPDPRDPLYGAFFACCKSRLQIFPEERAHNCRGCPIQDLQMSGEAILQFPLLNQEANRVRLGLTFTAEKLVEIGTTRQAAHIKLQGPGAILKHSFWAAEALLVLTAILLESPGAISKNMFHQPLIARHPSWERLRNAALQWLWATGSWGAPAGILWRFAHNPDTVHPSEWKFLDVLYTGSAWNQFKNSCRTTDGHEKTEDMCRVFVVKPGQPKGFWSPEYLFLTPHQSVKITTIDKNMPDLHCAVTPEGFEVWCKQIRIRGIAGPTGALVVHPQASAQLDVFLALSWKTAISIWNWDRVKHFHLEHLSMTRIQKIIEERWQVTHDLRNLSVAAKELEKGLMFEDISLVDTGFFRSSKKNLMRKIEGSGKRKLILEIPFTATDGKRHKSYCLDPAAFVMLHPGPTTRRKRKQKDQPKKNGD